MERRGREARSFTKGGCSGFLPKSACFQYSKPAKRWVDSSKVWDCWRTEVTRRIAMMARRIAAMRLVMRGVGAGGWRAGGSGVLFVFCGEGYETGWAGGVIWPM